MGDLLPAFRGIEEGLSVLLPAVSQVDSIQNNQYVIVALLGVACPGSLQIERQKEISLFSFIFRNANPH